MKGMVMAQSAIHMRKHEIEPSVAQCQVPQCAGSHHGSWYTGEKCFDFIAPPVIVSDLLLSTTPPEGHVVFASVTLPAAIRSPSCKARLGTKTQVLAGATEPRQ